MFRKRDRMIQIKSDAEVDLMRAAGLVVGRTLEALRAAARAEKRNFRYRRPAGFDRAAALARMEREGHVVRFRMPEQPVAVVDRVLGAIEFGEEHLDDFVVR